MECVVLALIFAEFYVELFEPVLTCFIILSRESLLLNLELKNLSLKLIKCFRLALYLHLYLGSCLIDKVDSLVRKETGSKVSVGKRCSCNKSLILDSYTVM